MDTTKKPSSSNSRLSDLKPCQLRNLVLQYLCHSRYVATAKAFARDSAVRHLDSDGDEIMLPDNGFGASRLPELTPEALSLVERREHVRKYILSGQAETAITFLNTHFPSVLSECQRMPQSTSDEIKYVSSTSVIPAHLNLNLRILAFIEECRTIPLPYPDTPEPSISPHAQFPTKLEDNHLAHLLTRLEKLRGLVNLLEKPEDQLVFRQELDHVGGLLAYKIPESSSVAPYLSQSRREAVADQIDRAILYWTGHPIISHMELCTRYTSVIWSTLNFMRVKVPPGARPPGVQLPSYPRKSSVPDKKGPGEKEDPEVVPPFDLRRFLDSK